jgi:hypothetical protein
MNRAVGHTSAIFDKNIKTIYLIKDIRKKLGILERHKNINPDNILFLSIDDIINGRLRGMHLPLVIDHEVWEYLIDDFMENYELKQEKEEKYV